MHPDPELVVPYLADVVMPMPASRSKEIEKLSSKYNFFWRRLQGESFRAAFLPLRRLQHKLLPLLRRLQLFLPPGCQKAEPELGQELSGRGWSPTASFPQCTSATTR